MNWAIPPRRNQGELRTTIIHHAALLQPKVEPWGNAQALLMALASVESDFGAWNVPRAEPSYMPGGRYYRSDDSQKQAYREWGALACCSYSSFQIMHPTARELGFAIDRCPLDLWFDDIAIYFVIEYIRKRILERGANSVEAFGDAYNSGNHRDQNIPVGYIEKFKAAYAGWLEKEVES